MAAMKTFSSYLRGHDLPANIYLDFAASRQTKREWLENAVLAADFIVPMYAESKKAVENVIAKSRNAKKPLIIDVGFRGFPTEEDALKFDVLFEELESILKKNKKRPLHHVPAQGH